MVVFCRFFANVRSVQAASISSLDQAHTSISHLTYVQYNFELQGRAEGAFQA